MLQARLCSQAIPRAAGHCSHCEIHYVHIVFLVLQVTAQNGDCLSFDVIEETLRATSLGRLQEGSEVNFER